ncbi:MAG TPA: lipase maturation factor family protein [Terriglobales bacterium]|jgi:lipase maturation factor 1|nr:lipase maturation factor family protein [Terriglobales bacterium]
MDWAPASAIRSLFDSKHGASNRLIPRWLFLRALGFIYFSAFFSLVFQIRGLIGPAGILPANEYLQIVARSFGHVTRFWFAPTLLWFSGRPQMLVALCWVGMLASLLLVFNVWPRGMLLICFVCFLSFVSAGEDFSGYQSDGMLLEAGFIALFFAPPGFRPLWGADRPPSRASLFLLQWEWFRIYFESGIAKLASGDPQWRHMTAMDEYYQNGPLPTWIGWYAQHLPHWFHVSTTYATLALELGLVWMLFLPRRLRIVCFVIATLWQLGVILTANYTFLNYLVLALGFLLLDDHVALTFLLRRWRKSFVDHGDQTQRPDSHSDSRNVVPESSETIHSEASAENRWDIFYSPLAVLKITLISVVLSCIFYATAVQLLWMVFPTIPLPTGPVAALDPFRIANRYGLFAVMTRGRYEIEFQGSQDGQVWVSYPFRFKPQDPSKPPGIYAPYQPRFDWNLWFASLGSWREYPIVPNTEVRLLTNDPDVLALFAGNPFPGEPPREVRAVLWQYWFTTMAERRAQGLWWRRQPMGLYAPVLERQPDGRIGVVEWPSLAPRL